MVIHSRIFSAYLLQRQKRTNKISLLFQTWLYPPPSIHLAKMVNQRKYCPCFRFQFVGIFSCDVIIIKVTVRLVRRKRARKWPKMSLIEEFSDAGTFNRKLYHKKIFLWEIYCWSDSWTLLWMGFIVSYIAHITSDYYHKLPVHLFH